MTAEYESDLHVPCCVPIVMEAARESCKEAYLKKEFSDSFKLCDAVVLCPIYSAGERIDYNYNQDNFSKLIAKKSNTQVINIKNKKDLKNFIRKNLFNNEMVICMGAGSISNWIREIGQELQ